MSGCNEIGALVSWWLMSTPWTIKDDIGKSIMITLLEGIFSMLQGVKTAEHFQNLVTHLAHHVHLGPCSLSSYLTWKTYLGKIQPA